VLGAGERVGIGVIGLGGRGGNLAKAFAGQSGVEVVALAEPDGQRREATAKRFPRATAYADLRKLLENDAVDAVAIATCNHWHCLAAIWACQAGKDVYVEKPLGHNQRESQVLVDAARKYDRVVQVGTQHRSDPVQERIKDLITSGELGAMQLVRASRHGTRKPIGRRTTPLPIPEHVDYDVWLGPAADEPIYRERLQYDWHWDFNTGNGEMGNWGIHVLDDVRGTALQDRIGLPRRVLAGGGRVAWDDAGNTPNVAFAYYDTGIVPVLFTLSNLPTPKAMHPKGVGTGYVVQFEDGYYAGGRGGGAVYSNDGKQIRRLRGDGGRRHVANFLDGVVHRDRTRLNAEAEVGHLSTGWCNVVNIACRIGGQYSRDEALEINRGYGPWRDSLERVEDLLERHGVDPTSDDFRVSPVLEIDPKAQRFTGPHADEANALLGREYRKAEFSLPAKV
jgi:predicted dehydrogenase